MSEAPPVLEVRNITKRFPGVIANDKVNITLRKGQVLGLLGENGAGKSTLMNMIYGLYHPDEGDILVNDKKVRINDANDAIKLGIGMVHQHFQLVPVLSVTENVMLGNESVRGGIFRFLDRQAARSRIMQIADQYGLDVDPDALVQNLPVGVQQRVEIIKALYRDAAILILDEPTAVLTPQETEGLFEIVETLLARGVSLIFISHKLKEIKRICDHVTVLRLGKVVGEADPKVATEGELASMMVGREVLLRVEKGAAHRGDVVLDVNGLSAFDDRDLPALRNVSFDVRAGEILGVAGVQGNGQTELVEVITGLRLASGGKIIIKGNDVTNASPRRLTEAGVAHVPENRSKNGIVGSFPITDNEVLQTYYRQPYSQGIVRNEPAIEDYASELVEKFDVRTPSIFAHMSTLSGGNQQKAIVAREFSRDSHLLIVAQPTRGVDVGSIEFIHQQIVAMRDAGTAVLLVSTELDEIMSLSDRIAVMYAGEINRVFDDATAVDRNEIGLAMAGTPEPNAASHQEAL